ncbi:Uncharacterised protein [Mycobacterium tuberculosis]|nr:Uncharacterised protein [Mycobacterium tuberculosis]
MKSRVIAMRPAQRYSNSNGPSWGNSSANDRSRWAKSAGAVGSLNSPRPPINKRPWLSLRKYSSRRCAVETVSRPGKMLSAAHPLKGLVATIKLLAARMLWAMPGHRLPL